MVLVVRHERRGRMYCAPVELGVNMAFRDADGSWKGRKAGLAAYAAKIMAEVDLAAYDDIEDLLDAMLAVERPEFNYA